MAALARLSPRARLYSAVPRSSVLPSISTRLSPFDLSHVAFPSRILASPGRMLYLSKSKWIVLRFGVFSHSLGFAIGAGAGAGAGAGGGGVAGTGAGAGAGGGCGAAGAGATAAVVAGRFGHPTRKRVRARRGTTRNA